MRGGGRQLPLAPNPNYVYVNTYSRIDSYYVKLAGAICKNPYCRKNYDRLARMLIKLPIPEVWRR